MRPLRTSLALLTLTCLAPFTAVGGSVTTLTSLFYSMLDPLTPVGTGTLDIFGPHPGDGTYSYDGGLDELNLSFTFTGGFTFTQADIISDTQDLLVVITGDSFQFSGPPVGVGFDNSSVQFLTGASDLLAFGSSVENEFLYIVATNYPSDTTPVYFGQYGSPSAIPEPASASLLTATAALAAFTLRRRRAAA